MNTDTKVIEQLGVQVVAPSMSNAIDGFDYQSVLTAMEGALKRWPVLRQGKQPLAQLLFSSSQDDERNSHSLGGYAQMAGAATGPVKPLVGYDRANQRGPQMIMINDTNVYAWAGIYAPLPPMYVRMSGPSFTPGGATWHEAVHAVLNAAYGYDNDPKVIEWGMTTSITTETVMAISKYGAEGGPNEAVAELVASAILHYCHKPQYMNASKLALEWIDTVGKHAH